MPQSKLQTRAKEVGDLEERGREDGAPGIQPVVTVWECRCNGLGFLNVQELDIEAICSRG